MSVQDLINLTMDARPQDDATGGSALARTASPRVEVCGKFFTRDGNKHLLRGVTYGPFKPEADGSLYHTPEVVSRDFAFMSRVGINCVRVYSIPPRWLLDCAQRNGLQVMVGLAWSQYVAFFDHPELLRDCFVQVDRALDTCSGHPAVLATVIGNEIPGTIVRWYGHQRIERHLEQMHRRLKSGDRDMLTTYANYPTTEYLDLPFLDFTSFNVYFNSIDRYAPYLSRLQNIADQRPLVISEIGFETQRFDASELVSTSSKAIASCFQTGCAGLFYFSWTDEWFRHGQEIEDWKFGLTQKDRAPRATLASLETTYRSLPFPAPEMSWPTVSVVICSRNGARTIEQSIREALKLEYPDFEVIVVNDGSTDETPEIARRYPVRLINQENQGLSAARNAGAMAAKGSIVAYLDDDAYPDPHWLHYLVHTMKTGNFVGAGGPNVVPQEDGLIAQCVARSPGGPTHVLITDTIAEHIPGCNMAFDRAALLEIGGFDKQFRIAGDDVDICWRLQRERGPLGFAPTALVWHHRRSSIRAFWKQQKLYGRAEALLERKWPEKYNTAGHAIWEGRLYGAGGPQAQIGVRRRIYHGVWGEALFQQLYHLPPSLFWSLPSVPEWYVLTGILAILSVLGIWWDWLLLALPFLLAAIFYECAVAVCAAQRTRLDQFRNPVDRFKMRCLIAFLYRMQPMARLIGRYRFGLTPWRLRGASGFALPKTRLVDVARKKWRMPSEWLSLDESYLKSNLAFVRRGSDFDSWDLDMLAGLVAGARVRLMTEDLEYGSQLLRYRVSPHVTPLGWVALGVALFLSALAISQEDDVFTAVSLAMLMVVSFAIVREAGAAVSTVVRAVKRERADA